MDFESKDLRFNCENYALNTETTTDQGGQGQYRPFGKKGLGFGKIWGKSLCFDVDSSSYSS